MSVETCPVIVPGSFCVIPDTNMPLPLTSIEEAVKQKLNNQAARYGTCTCYMDGEVSIPYLIDLHPFGLFHYTILLPDFCLQRVWLQEHEVQLNT